MTVVATGDTIVLADGTYREDILMTQSGAPGRYITIRAANPGMAKLVGPADSYSALAMANVGWVRVEGLDVRAHLGHGMESANSHHIQLVGNARTSLHQTSGISVYQARAYDTAAGFHMKATT